MHDDHSTTAALRARWRIASETTPREFGHLSIGPTTCAVPLDDARTGPWLAAHLRNAYHALGPPESVWTSEALVEPVRAALRSLFDEPSSPWCQWARRLGATAPPEVRVGHPAPDAKPIDRVSPTEHAVPALGVDIGGTDMKLVLHDGEVIHSAVVRWDTPPSHYATMQHWSDTILAAIDAFVAEAGVTPKVAGLSFPDIVIDGRIAGGITGKTRGVAAHHGGYGEGFERDLDSWLRPLPDRIGERVGVPVRVTSDACAAALACDDEIVPCLAVSLGTSMAAAAVDAEAHPHATPLYASALVTDPFTDVRRHDTLGTPGSAQQGCTKKGALASADRWGLPGQELDPADRLNRLLERGSHDTESQGWLKELGESLGDALAEILWWTQHYSPEQVLLMGRMVMHPVAAESLLPTARSRLLAANPGATVPRLVARTRTQAVYAQAVAVARWACRCL